MPKGGRSDQRCRPSAEVVHQQHKREREPVTHHRAHLVAATDAGGNEPGRDVEQQQFAIECEPVSQSSVDHDQGPDGDCRPADQRQPTLRRCRSSGPFDDLGRHRGEVPGAAGPSSRCWLPFARQHLDFCTGRD